MAQDGEQVIGFAYGTSHRERAAYRWAAEASVYIDRAHHRRGIGRRLYRSLGSAKLVFVIFITIIGILIGAAGGRVARVVRERNGVFSTDVAE